MNKARLVAVTSVIIVIIVALRLYRKYERQKVKEAQQKELRIQLQKTLQKQKEEAVKITEAEYEKRLDSIDSVKKDVFDAKMKRLKENQKRIQAEIEKAKKAKKKE